MPEHVQHVVQSCLDLVENHPRPNVSSVCHPYCKNIIPYIVIEHASDCARHPIKSKLEGVEDRAHSSDSQLPAGHWGLSGEVAGLAKVRSSKFGLSFRTQQGPTTQQYVWQALLATGGAPHCSSIATGRRSAKTVLGLTVCPLTLPAQRIRLRCCGLCLRHSKTIEPHRACELLEF